MIQFASPYGSKPEEFSADCPVCERAVWLRYQYEWYAGDAETRGRPLQEAHSPEIVEQECSCLLGQDWAEEALARHLDHEAWERRTYGER